MKELRKTFWDVISITGATVIALPLMVVSESIQARGLGPDDYGRVALIISIFSLLYLFGLYWLKSAVLRFAKEEFVAEGHFRRTSAGLLSLNFISLIIVFSFFLIFQEKIFAFLGIKLAYVTGMIISGLFLLFLKEFFLEILKVINKIKVQAFLGKAVNKGLVVVGLILLVSGIWQLNVINVILVFLLADLLTIVLSLFYIDHKFFFPLDFDSSLFKRIVLFSLPLLFASWSGYIINWIDIYVINYFMTTEYVGIYHAAYKLLNAVQFFLGTSLIITISTPLIMAYKTTGQTDKVKEHYMKRTVPQLSFFGMLFISLLLMVSDFVFLLVYGREFIQSALVFKILIASQGFFIVSAAYTGIITSYDLTKIVLYLGLLAGFLNIVMDILLVPLMGINGAAIASCIVFCLIPVLRFRLVNRKFALAGSTPLVFPVITLLIMLINISPLYFIFRWGVSLIVLSFAVQIVRKRGLFQVKDMEILDGIDMSVSARSVMKKAIRFMSG